MASQFTYEIKKLGSNKTIVVYNGIKQIYTNTSNTLLESDLEQIAKRSLKDNYGDNINQMTRVPSSTPSIPNNFQTAAEAQQQLNNTQATAESISTQQQLKSDEIQKSANDKVDYLKDVAKQSTKDTSAALALILTPILLQFIRAENTADVLIKKMVKDVKKQLQNKGVLTVNNNVITFTPSNKGNYDVFKQNFDKNKANLIKTLNTLKTTLDALAKVSTFVNIGLSAIKVYIKIKTNKIKTQETAVQTELASPTPGGAKPISASLLPKINKSLKQLDKYQKKVDTYQGVIMAISIITPLFKDMLTKTQTKVNQLQFIINTGADTGTLNTDVGTQGMDVTVVGVNETAPINSEYTNSYGKNYILKLVTTPSGFLQYQALDSFSKMKITQTAPSKSKTPDELFTEIKQILG
jgi:hypothetical protein